MSSLLHSHKDRKARFIPSHAIRELRAAMALKHLRLDQVAGKARIPYAVASQLLNGKKNDPARVARIRAVIEAAPMPEATV